MGIISHQRALRIAVEGSPTFFYENDSISASGIEIKDLESDSDKASNLPAKYLPLDSITIANTSSSNIRVDAGAHIIIVSANSVKTKTNISYRTFKITNLDTSNSISADKILTSCWKEGLTQDTLLRRQAYSKPILGVLLPFKNII